VLKFKKFNVAKRIFDLSANYKEASDNEVRQFCALRMIEADADQVIALSTAPIRKLISSVQNSGVLNNFPPAEIARKAAPLMNVTVNNGRIILPATKAEIRNLLTFLDHGIYRSPVDDTAYMANSRRPFTA
jgi:hypothetical protein